MLARSLLLLWENRRNGRHDGKQWGVFLCTWLWPSWGELAITCPRGACRVSWLVQTWCVLGGNNVNGGVLHTRDRALSSVTVYPVVSTSSMSLTVGNILMVLSFSYRLSQLSQMPHGATKPRLHVIGSQTMFKWSGPWIATSQKQGINTLSYFRKTSILYLLHTVYPLFPFVWHPRWASNK